MADTGAIFAISDDSGDKILIARPDWITGASSKDSYVSSTLRSSNTMPIYKYHHYNIVDFIEYLSSRIIDKYYANYFKHLLYEIFVCMRSDKDLNIDFALNIERFTYNLSMFMKTNVFTKKYNYFFPKTDSYIKKRNIVYLLISLQHVVCNKLDQLDIKIPVVDQLSN